MNGPLFPIGFEVQIGYVGLYRADDPPGTSKRYAVAGIRLVPRAHEDENGKIEITYPKGWEYLMARRYEVDGEAERWDEDGWHSEADLLKKGYRQPEMATV